MTRANATSVPVIPQVGQAKRLMIRLVLPGLLLLPLTRLIPKPDHLPPLIAPRFSFVLFAAGFFAWMHVCAALLFFMALPAFQPRIRRAYQAICFGSVCMGLALLQPPIILGLNLTETSFYKNGIPLLLQVVTVSVFLWALCLFAHELGDKKLWKKAVYILPVVLVLTVVGGLLASDPFNTTSIFRLWAALLGSVNAVIVLRIKHMASRLYANALAWFFLALAVGAVAQGLGLVAWMRDDPFHPALILPYAMTAVLYVKAAYAFNKIREY
jgi:hypothetical protein